MTANGPLPTHLTFLSSLASHPTGTKVRFLGCVTGYDVHHGILRLAHAYPSNASLSPLSSNATAVVDVTVIVDSLKRDILEVGAWLNVIGYVKEQRQGGNKGGSGSVGVQATMIWAATGVRLGEYEKAVEGRLKVEGSDDDATEV